MPPTRVTTYYLEMLDPRDLLPKRSSRKDLASFPKQVRRDLGQALYAAQCG